MHAPEIFPHALRIRAGGKIIAYSGNTQWKEQRVEISRATDSFICECYGFDTTIKNCLDYQALQTHLLRLATRLLIPPHMGEERLDNLHRVALESAAAGMGIDL